MFDIDPDRLYEAMTTRDARWDGRFFVGVTSTGIYCRPICPAPTPKRQNCTFWPSAAAAGQAGFRPCKRCRPETAPNSPAWAGTEATVRRALKLISAGALNGGSVETLAARLGVGARHLRRLFDTHLGAPPAAVARTERLHLAKQLLERTNLPMAQVALGAGFGSVRRFNDVFKTVYGAPPGTLRSGAKRRDAEAAPIELKLGLRAPYDWASLLSFLKARAVPGLENCEAGYVRSVTLNGAIGVLSVAALDTALTVRLRLDSPAALLAAVETIRTLFDLDTDTAAIDAHLCTDRRLARAVRNAPGLRVPGAWDPFELAVRAIIGQQITVAGARTMLGRLVEAHGTRLANGSETDYRLFPGPERIADADLTGIGLTRTRAATVSTLARAVADGALRLDGAGDADHGMAQLTLLPGIGRWTAGYIAMRALKHPDAFPHGDVALVRAARRLGIADDAKSLDAAAEAWRPWRAYAAMHLWKSLEMEPRHVRRAETVS